MQLLKLLECLYHILVLSKLLSELAELFLSLKILLEIKITKFAIDLHHIIELLHIELICLIDISIALSRNRTDSSPSVLDLAEFRECRIHILLFLDERLKVSNHSLLGSEIILAFLLKLLIVLSPFSLVLIIKFLETFFNLNERIFCYCLVCCLLLAFSKFSHCKSSLSLLLVESLVKCSLESICIL